MRRPASRRRGDRGVASMLVLAMAAVLVVVSAIAVAVVQVVGARHAAAAAADLGALAGAGAGQRGGDPCRVAAAVVDRNDARLVDCRVQGADVLVTTAVTTDPLLGLRWQPTGTARAGPAP